MRGWEKAARSLAAATTSSTTCAAERESLATNLVTRNEVDFLSGADRDGRGEL